MSEDKKIRGTVDAIKDLAEAVPVYQDAIQPAAKEIGKDLQTIAKTVHVALSPLRGLIWGWEQIEDFVKRTVAEKLKNVPTERIVTPALNVAGPAVEALRFVGNEPDLRELYAQLLATSMDANTAAEVHPSFVEMIKQMTPDEARLLKRLSERRPAPVVDLGIEWTNGDGGEVDALVNCSLLGVEAACEHVGNTPVYLDNLCRLGIVEIRDEFYTASDVYEPIELSPEFLEAKRLIDEKSGLEARVHKKMVRVTNLGRQFSEAVVAGGEGSGENPT